MPKTFRGVVAAAGAALLALLMAACAQDTDQPSASTVQTAPEPLSACELLSNAAIPGVEIATAEALAVSERRIQLPAPVTLRREVPHCRIVGTIDSAIGFELLMPDEWNGKFLMGGGGGYVGSIQNSAEELPIPGGSALERGYATVGTDTGHQAGVMDASWALNDPQAQENFAHRAVHRTAEVSKQIIAQYYTDEPAFSYFFGCSRGGGQALISAQRYPQDFDGIISGAPALDWTGFASGMIQTQQRIFPDPSDLSAPVITAQNRELLNDSILAQCDTLDGLADGILTDPRMCAFDPATLPRCESGPAADCLTDTQLEAIQSVYSPVVIDGEELYTGWPFGGETVGWPAWITKAEGGPALPPGAPPNAHFGFGTQLVKNFIYSDPQWTYVDYDFDDWAERSAPVAELLNATDPDLSQMRDRGAKLIVWHGWSDSALSAIDTIDYYEAVGALDSSADEYLRMYLMPGVAHCFGGPGPDQVDWIGAIEQWVEQDIRPAELIAQKRDPSGNITMQRPICPYPQQPRYSGSGDASNAASFVCAAD